MAPLTCSFASGSTSKAVVPMPTLSIKVETPETLRSSNSVCPSTSISPLKSAAPANVETPDTLRSSNSVCPSTSISPLASISPVKVDTPDTFNSVRVPKLVSEELTTVGPRVVLFNTESVPVLNSPPSVTPSPIEDSNAVSYTHLTLPTKRIV